MLLKDVITIPESVRRGDLVFKISDATEQTRATLDQYVVTEQLEGAFIEALGLIGSAVSQHTSKAAYLSGSFGAGKSSFMGVLQLLLDEHPDALAKPELGNVVAELRRHDIGKILTVPYHLIGAKDLESAIFGGYVEHIQKVRPDASLPAVFADEALLENADVLREKLSDDQFFALLGGTDEGWGTLGTAWDAAAYDDARSRPFGDPVRERLVQALVAGPLSGYAEMARDTRSGYVDMDTGLKAISRHAKDLGYSGLILFLDELILWLMSRMADQAFVTAEASKLSKLVEGSDADRPAPIIALISRQRDLRKLLDKSITGIEQLSFIDQLAFQAERFFDIELDDTNLRVIAHHRLLRPNDDTGREALDTAFASLGLTDRERDVLRGPGGDDDAFRLTYPFSPTFLNVVVDVASSLQRTRTGLRVLLDLLVENRDTIEIGDLVPLGDLYDVLAKSDDLATDALRQNFDAARRIYESSLRPMLLETHKLSAGEEPTPAFRNDDRLIKTLLLSALVPNSEPFRNMTASTLVALNHGLIHTPVPGQQVATVVRKLQDWAARVGELQVGGDPQNPTVNIVLSEVDTRAILESVRGNDNPGARRRLIIDMIRSDLGMDDNRTDLTRSVLWRGVRRETDLVFGNIGNHNELPDAAFEPADGRWKVVIDFPFDDEGRTPVDDLARIDELRAHNWRTLCWLPSFFTAEFRALVGDLVLIDYLIPIPGQSGERFMDATKHLSAENREAARPQLETRQRTLRSRLTEALHQAYGLRKADPNVIDSSHDLKDHFPTLLSGVDVQPPQAATLAAALDAVITKGLEHSFPAAPQVEGEVKAADLRTVADICHAALEQPDRRVAQVDPASRKVMQRIANPLQLGTQSEQAFVLQIDGGYWGNEFTKKTGLRAEAGMTGNPTVRELRGWIDEPDARGLSVGLQNLVILVWAAATNHQFVEHGGPVTATIDTLRDHWEVVGVPLPDAAVWTDAVERAQRVFGVGALPNEASLVGMRRLDDALAAALREHHAAVDGVVGSLETLAALVSDGETPERVRTAEVAEALCAQIATASTDVERVERLAAVELAPSAAAVGASIKSAAAVDAKCASLELDMLEAAFAKPGGDAIRSELRELLRQEELATSFVAAIDELYPRLRKLAFGDASTPRATPAVAAADDPMVAAPDLDTGVGRGAAIVLDERSLDRNAAMKKLKELRDRIKSGDLDGDRFDIRIVAVDGNDASS